jgi:hypothetical protein
MRAMDVMTSEVITVGEDASVQEAAKLMAEHAISAVPVVDRDKRVVGMVSEGDLLHRAETGTERQRSWWLEMVASTNQLAGEYVKSHSGVVKDVMTRDRGHDGRRYRNSTGDESHQTRSGAARREAGWDRQSRKPRAGAGDDDYRTAERCRGR